MIQLKTLGTLCIMLVLSLAAKAGDASDKSRTPKMLHPP